MYLFLHFPNILAFFLSASRGLYIIILIVTSVLPLCLQYKMFLTMEVSVYDSLTVKLTFLVFPLLLLQFLSFFFIFLFFVLFVCLFVVAVDAVLSSVDCAFWHISERPSVLFKLCLFRF